RTLIRSQRTVKRPLSLQYLFLRAPRSLDCNTCFQIRLRIGRSQNTAAYVKRGVKSFAQNNTIAVEHTNLIMAHTPLAKLLCHAASTAAQSDMRDATTDDSAMSRREFVRTISAATAGLALPSSLFGTTRVATSARVVVVGAGLAKLI